MPDSQFPHLPNATEYPGTENIDAYAAANRFDYDRWTDDVKIHLCNVTWDGIDSIVDWTKEKKETYFNDTSKREIEMPTAFQMPAREDTFKVPVPFITAQTYNYIYIDVPLPPDDSRPLDYVEPRAATRRFYWFIDDMRQVAPSTTELQLRQDLWTTYSDYLQMKNCVLQRGHYPVSQQPSVSTFLSNPIGNMRWLAAPDVEAGQVGTRTHETFVPMNQGTRYVVFASTMSLSGLQSCGRASDAGTNTDAVYEASDIGWDTTYTKHLENVDFNYDAQANIKSDSYSWDGMPSHIFDDCHVTALQHSARSPQYLNNYALWAVDGSDYQEFIEWLHEKVPFVIQTIAGIFSIDKSLVDWSESYTVGGITVRLIRGLINEVIQGLTLSQSDFDYPSQAQRFTKLYTSPYSYVEISDYEGRDYRFEIQQVASSAAVVGSANVAFPTLVIDAYVRGVGGSGSSNTYATHNNENTESDNTDPVGDHSARFTWSLPCSGMPIRAYHQYSIDNDRARKNRRQEAIRDYRVAARNFNALWGAARVSNRVASDNGNLAIDATATINSNANEALNKCKWTVNSSDNYLYGTTDYGATDMESVADCNLLASGIGAYVSGQQAQSAATAQNDKIQRDYERNHDYNFSVAARDQTLAESLLAINNNAAAMTNFANNVGGILSAATGSAGSGIGNQFSSNPNVAGSVVSAATSLSASAIGAAVSSYSTAVAMNASANTTVATNTRNWNVMCDAWIDDTSGVNYRLRGSARTYNNEMADNTVSYNKQSARQNIRANTRAAHLTHSFTDENIATQQTADDKQRENSQEAGVQNADNNRIGTRHGAQITVDVAQSLANRDYNQTKIENNIIHGEFRQDSTGVINEKKCGVAWQVMRQATGDVWRVASEFARFGYTLGQFVETSDLQPMNMFSYWQCLDVNFVMDDAALQADNVPTAALDGIRRMFMDGITVWSEPAQIGQVNIYDN